MDTIFLIPRVLTIVQKIHADPKLRGLELDATVWARRPLKAGQCFDLTEGELRLERLEVFKKLPANDVRMRFGCVEEINEIDEVPVRHCTWVRFLSSSHDLSKVNIVVTKLKDVPIFQIVKAIEVNEELVAYFDEQTLPVAATLPVPVTPPPPHPTRDRVMQDAGKALISTPLYRFGNIYSRMSRHEISPPERMRDECFSISSSDKSPDFNIFKKMSPLCPIGSLGVDDTDTESPNKLSTSNESMTSNCSLPYPDMGASVFPSGKQEFTLSRRKEKTWLPCESCGKKFDRPSLLKRHIRTHTGEKPHACDICAKAFSTSSSLNTHRRIHSGEKPHQCQVCGKRFTASSNLYYHRMTHKKVKPHKCSLCSKSFPTPGDLKSHMYVHNGSWPFKCDVCQRGFSKQTNLKNHMLLHSGDKPFSCSFCDKKFALNCNLKTHLKTHEDDNVQTCRTCNSSFKSLNLMEYCQSCIADRSMMHTNYDSLYQNSMRDLIGITQRYYK